MKKVDNLIHSLGLKYNLPDFKIKEIVESQFAFAKSKIKQMELMKLTDKEEFEELKTTFLFKKLGRLYVNERKINRIIKLNNEENGK
mgnify:CR=1 FL=1